MPSPEEMLFRLDHLERKIDRLLVMVEDKRTMKDAGEEVWLTSKDFCALVGMNPNSLHYYMNKGELGGENAVRRLGGRWRFHKVHAVNSFLNRSGKIN